MSPRQRVLVLVGAAALAAAGATVGVTALTATGTGAAARLSMRPGVPPLVLDLGIRTDPEAVALRRAGALFDSGKREAAAAIFGRYTSDEAQVGSALAAWPRGLRGIEALGASRRTSAVVQLHYGLALYWLGRDADANAAWRRAGAAGPDTLYAIRASDLLHPKLPIPGLPQFVPSFDAPPQIAKLAPPAQYAFLAARARTGDAHAKLLYGVALQRLNRPLSAEKQFAAAAALAPNDPEALVAADVGLFDKAQPAAAFSRLGPLSKRFPRAVTVRFHLGLLLLWLGQVAQARIEFRQAVADAPDTPLGRDAAAFLVRLDKLKS